MIPNLQGSYQSDTTKKWESILTVDPISKSSGGAIKCAYSFTETGSPITSTTNFRVRCNYVKNCIRIIISHPYTSD